MVFIGPCWLGMLESFQRSGKVIGEKPVKGVLGAVQKGCLEEGGTRRPWRETVCVTLDNQVHKKELRVPPGIEVPREFK